MFLFFLLQGVIICMVFYSMDFIYRTGIMLNTTHILNVFIKRSAPVRILMRVQPCINILNNPLNVFLLMVMLASDYVLRRTRRLTEMYLRPVHNRLCTTGR